MPSPFSFRRVHRPLILFALCPFVLAGKSNAQSTGVDPQQSAYRNSIAEETVRKETDKIRAEITQLLAELKLNGLEGKDATILTDASNHLDSLSRDEMQKVIDSLQAASISTQAQDRQQSLVNAYQQQKDILLKLKALAAGLAAQDSQKQISSQLQNLIARQSANIRQTSTLQDNGHSITQLNADEKSSHEVVSSEQASIGGEIDLLVKVLAATPPASSTDGDSDGSKAVLDALNSGGLDDAAHAATTLTSAGPFSDAVTKQKAVRDGLIALLSVSLAKANALDQLQDVLAQINQSIDQQKDLEAVTRQATLSGSILAGREARINDQILVIEVLLKPVSPPAFAEVTVAQQAVAETSTAMQNAAHTMDAAPQEQAVVDDLTKAAAMLDKEVAAVQQQENLSPGEQLAQLQQLQSEINQAQNNPNASAADLQKVGQDAVAPAPQAAGKIADAAGQLQQSPSNKDGANKSLAQASAIVQQQEDALKQTVQSLQALTQASQQLSKAQQEAAQANQSMQNKSNPDLTQAARDLSQAQANVDQVQQQPPPDVSPEAQKALQQASDALKKATTQAVQAQGDGARAENQKAIEAMKKAQAGLGEALAKMQQQGQGKGQGKGKDQEQGQDLAQSQGQGEGQGHGQEGKGPGHGAGGGKNGPSGTQLGSGAGNSGGGEQDGPATGSVESGTALSVGGLSPKDREAISQFQSEKSPPEYAPLVQQYMKNLADGSTTH
jgi:hypothetical protein